MVIHAECSRMEIRSLLKTIKLDISKHQSKRSKPSLDLLDSFRLKIWRSTKSSGKFQESGKQRALQTDVSVWSESGWWQNHGIYKFLNAFKSRQQGSRPKCWIDRLQAVRRIEQATTRLRCSPWMEYQYQAKGKPSEKRAANEISRKLAYLSSSGINFVALMASAPLLSQRKRSTQALFCSILGVQLPRTHSSYLIVTTSRPFSLPGPSLPRHFSFGIFLETLPVCSLVGLFSAHWNSSQGLQCNKIIQNTNTNKNLSTNKNRGQR